MKNKPILAHEKELNDECGFLKSRYVYTFIIKTLVLIAISFGVIIYFLPILIGIGALIVFILLCLFYLYTKPSIVKIKKYLNNKKILHRIDEEKKSLERFLESDENDAFIVKEKINELLRKNKREENEALKELYNYYLIELENLKTKLIYDKNRTRLKRQYRNEYIRVNAALLTKKENEPLIVAKNKIDDTLNKLKNRKTCLVDQWKVVHDKLSWWSLLSVSSPNFREMDSFIRDLERMKSSFNYKYAKKLKLLEELYNQKATLLSSRLNEAYSQSKIVIDENKELSGPSDRQLQYGLWGSIFGMTASLSNDLYEAHGLYDALRGVHGGFSTMTDSEIWMETLWMEPDKLIGLASFAKGAYFEKLVAEDTGGKLFEHFNHKDTDIVIDGEEIQLKATDSVAYINSVNDDILVMSTTEVADKTDAIDSGISNLELENTTALALGGTVSDPGDVIADGIISGLAGLGVFASIRGLNHACEKFNNGGDGVEAAFEGLGVAIEGTAKGIVDASELIYNVATSKPSKAIGRAVVKSGKGVVWLLKPLGKLVK